MHTHTERHTHADVKSDRRRERENSYSGTIRGYLMYLPDGHGDDGVFVFITSPTRVLEF